MLPLIIKLEIEEKLKEFVKNGNYKARMNAVNNDPEKQEENIAAWIKAYEEVKATAMVL